MTEKRKQSHQLAYYYRNKDFIEAKRDDINQVKRDYYWRKKTGSTTNIAFVKYITKLLLEDKKMNQ